ncbi:hypothetical protein KY335_04625 [Candidatus Woesearchaeota archaeon]|nr:hypothetical protein [Candidatus Woesearchaeota archaeon]
MVLNRLIIGALFGLAALASLVGCNKEAEERPVHPFDGTSVGRVYFIPQHKPEYREKKIGPATVIRTNEDGEEVEEKYYGWYTQRPVARDYVTPYDLRTK